MTIKFRRIFRHWLQTDWQVRHAFPSKTLAAIEQEIKAGEALHAGEIRFAVEGALSGPPLYQDQSARERAIDVFAQLRIWDTDERSGVLIYLLFADRSVEIVADRGIHARAGTAEWERICRDMEAALRAGRYEQGAVDGVRSLNQVLTTHFPARGPGRNELSDKVVLL